MKEVLNGSDVMNDEREVHGTSDTITLMRGVVLSHLNGDFVTSDELSSAFKRLNVPTTVMVKPWYDESDKDNKGRFLIWSSRGIFGPEDLLNNVIYVLGSAFATRLVDVDDL